MAKRKSGSAQSTPTSSRKKKNENKGFDPFDFNSLLNNERFLKALSELERAKDQLRQSREIARRQLQIAKKEIKKLMVTIVVWLMCSYLMSVMGVVASLRAPDAEPLPDLGFDLFSYVHFPELPNAILLTTVIATVIRVIMHPARVIIFRRLLIVHSVICVLRSFCIVATSLPDPLPRCHTFELSRNLFVEATYRFFTLGFDVCGDVFFSGHIAICVLMGMVWDQYTNEKLYKSIIWGLVVLEGCSLLSMRWHYTIDIIIGAYLAFRIWATYHSYSPLFRWMESSPAVLAFNDQPSTETIEMWLARAPKFPRWSKLA